MLAETIAGVTTSPSLVESQYSRPALSFAQLKAARAALDRDTASVESADRLMDLGTRLDTVLATLVREQRRGRAVAASRSARGALHLPGCRGVELEVERQL